MREKRTVCVMSAHALLRQGLTELIGSTARVIATTYTRPRTDPDVALVDLDNAREDTLKLVQRLRPQFAESYFVVIGTAMRIAASVDDSADAELESTTADAAALESVIAGRAPRPSSELARAHRLWAEVTPRQREVLRMLALGADNARIGSALGIGERAVKAHVSTSLALFSLANRTELALLAAGAGLRPVR
jgi:DNA-binding NarL/FixJ family response regulator